MISSKAMAKWLLWVSCLFANKSHYGFKDTSHFCMNYLFVQRHAPVKYIS